MVDVSRHFTRIMEIEAPQRRVRVQPSVVRNELNLALAPHRVFFAPETSTQNRCMIGGMVGNNACGTNSVVYGSTHGSVISWQHINLLGEYDFSDEKLRDYVGIRPPKLTP